MMKIIVLCLSLLIHNYKITAQSQEVKIQISNLENRKGTIYLGLFNEGSTFTNAEKAVYKKMLPVNGLSQLSFSFDNIPYGTYAVSVFLDENSNGKLDKNFFGVPSEKYGFSNNVYPALRAATFQESAFKLPNNGHIVTINLK